MNYIIVESHKQRYFYIKFTQTIWYNILAIHGISSIVKFRKLCTDTKPTYILYPRLRESSPQRWIHSPSFYHVRGSKANQPHRRIANNPSFSFFWHHFKYLYNLELLYLLMIANLHKGERNRCPMIILNKKRYPFGSVYGEFKVVTKS